MSRTDVDVVVVGAGVVGCATALALAASGCDVLLADARLPNATAPSPDDAYDLRVFALAHGSRRLLEHLEVWRELPQNRIAAYRSMRVWDEHGSGEIEFDASLLGEEALGFIVEQRALLAACMVRLRESMRVELRADAIASMHASPRDAEVHFAQGTPVRTRLVVAADGASSTLREAAGITVAKEHYAQRAVVAHVRTERAHEGVARQRFATGGPLALLPLADGRASIVWSLPDEEAERLLALDDAAFLAELTAASGGVLGRCLEASPRASFPLLRWQAQSFVGVRLALAGDAAHGVHPLAGQGLNLGLQDVASLHALIGAAQKIGGDVGDATLLARYARARQPDNAIAGHSFGALQHLFASRSPLLAFARGFGMNLVNRATPLKRLLAEHASAIS